MAKPLYLAENFFSLIQFPNHLITSSETEFEGTESFRVGTARRGALNQFSNGFAATNLVATVALDRVRAADLIIIDRNSLAAGRVVTIEGANTADFVGAQQIIPGVVLPTDVVYGSSLLDPSHPIRTNEGAWIFSFPETSHLYYRVTVDADVIASPTLGGIYIGKSYEPENPVLPHDDESTYADFTDVRRGLPDNDQRYGRFGDFHMKMTNESEWARARLTLRELPARGHPIWIVPDQIQAERTWLGYTRTVVAAYGERPQGRDVTLSLEEYDPRRPV